MVGRVGEKTRQVRMKERREKEEEGREDGERERKSLRCCTQTFSLNPGNIPRK